MGSEVHVHIDRAFLVSILLGASALSAGPLTAQEPAAAATEAAVPAGPAADPLLWPEDQRSFAQDGPALLLTAEQRARFLAADGAGREAFVHEFLGHDPIPQTPANELQEGIDRRLRLAREEFLSPRDVRSQLLFLNGRPAERLPIDCGTAFKPLEIWTYRKSEAPAATDDEEAKLVVYRPSADEPFRLWRPGEGKRLLYTPEMEYWLEQWEELRGRISVKRFDLQICKQAVLVDRATGIAGLSNVIGRKGREETVRGIRSSFYTPYVSRLWPWQRPGDPQAIQGADDLAAWARQAVATKLPDPPPALAVGPMVLQFPARDGQRIVTRAFVELTPKSDMVATNEDGKEEISVVAEGVIEQEGRTFETFRARFRLPPPPGMAAIPLAIDRSLRPEKAFLLRVRLTAVARRAEALLSQGFTVPRAPVALPEHLAALQPVQPDFPAAPNIGPDTLVLVPPPSDIVLGLWRAEALVTGERIKKVTFSVDGQAQLSRSKPPYSAELRLATVPTQQVVRVEGFDEQGKVIASDEVLINQPQGAFEVRVVEPRRGAKLAPGKIAARAEIVLPPERRIEMVEFRVNDTLIASRPKPPWEATVELPPGEEVVYLAVSALLDDGTRAEDVRFLRAPEYLEEVEVDLVELYTAVTDRAGQPVRGLTADDFQVIEGGAEQKLVKFELVESLPLTVGIAIDTSGSMTESLAEAQRAAAGFLSNVVKPGDKAFALAFSGRPVLLMPLTDDVPAVTQSLEGLQAVGATAFHDAVVHSLYYFRGTRGQKALVLLSDGDDTASSLKYQDALGYAQRSGVAVYTIGLGVSTLGLGLRNKLSSLAEETGGRYFSIGKAAELAEVYGQIEAELRSRYLLAFNATTAAGAGGFRAVEVKVKKGGLKARTARGYYP
jgi:Ca-activated chloride channel family protein